MTTTTTAVRSIPLASVDPGPNDRTVFASTDLDELAASMAAHGLVQPITVRPMGDRFEIVAGERRSRAARQLGWTTIDAIVRDLDDRAAADAMLVENTARADLNPIDEARAYQSRIDRFGMTNTEVAAVAGVSVQKVFTRVRLLRLVAEAQHLVGVGQLAGDAAQLLADLDANRQRIALTAIVDRGIDKGALRSLVARLAAEQAAQPMFDTGDFLQIEEYVATATASRVATKPEQMRAMIAYLLDAAGDAVDPGMRAAAERLAAK